MSSFQFQYIFFVWLFLALFVFLLLFIGVKKWKRGVVKKIGQPSLVRAMVQRYSPRRFNLKFVLVCIAFAMGVLAVMSLRKPGGSDGITRKGIDVVYALDVSRSMLAEDITPNRLERAKQFISKMMDAMPDSRVGLILFAGKAYVQMPLSPDHSAAQMFVSEASPDAVPMKGTVIGDALKESLKAFGERDTKYRAIVLISDGEDHDEEAIKLSKELATRGLMVNTVGIGSPQGSFIPDDSTSGGHKVDTETGIEVISKLNEQELKQIAANTNGVYVHLENSDDAIKKVTANLSQIAKKVTGDSSLMSFTYYFWIFVALMLVLLVWEQLLPEGRRKKINR
ncbi:MAG: VWA domain-containing protein [Niabella sp.]